MKFSSLWMRSLDFVRLRNLFAIVAQNDGAFRATDLNLAAVGRGVLVNKQGQPFKPTPIYHYRRTLVRLDLLSVQDGRYCIARGRPPAHRLMKALTHGPSLSAEERDAFASAVVHNQDSYDAFFAAFVSNRSRPFDIESFLMVASPVTITVSGTRRQEVVRITNRDTGAPLVLEGENAIQATLGGVLSTVIENSPLAVMKSPHRWP